MTYNVDFHILPTCVRSVSWGVTCSEFMSWHVQTPLQSRTKTSTCPHTPRTARPILIFIWQVHAATKCVLLAECVMEWWAFISKSVSRLADPTAADMSLTKDSWFTCFGQSTLPTAGLRLLSGQTRLVWSCFAFSWWLISWACKRNIALTVLNSRKCLRQIKRNLQS